MSSSPLELPPRSARRKARRARAPSASGGAGRAVAAAAWLLLLALALAPALDCCVPAAGIRLGPDARAALPWVGFGALFLVWAGLFAWLTGRVPLGHAVVAALAVAGVASAARSATAGPLRSALNAAASLPGLGLYYGVLALAVAGWLCRPAFSRAWLRLGLRAARADAVAAASLGVPAGRLRWTAFLTTAIPVALGGAALGLSAAVLRP